MPKKRQPLPPRARPITEVNGALVAVLPPTGLDEPQQILIENTWQGMCLAFALDPVSQDPSIDGYVYVAQTGEVGANIVHLIDTLAEIQRRAPALVQLPLANLTGDL